MKYTVEKILSMSNWENPNSGLKSYGDYLYMAICDNSGVCRIGRSMNPEQLVSSINNSSISNFRLAFKIKGAGYLDWFIHNCFSENLVKGRKYYKSNKNIIDMFNRLEEKFNSNVFTDLKSE